MKSILEETLSQQHEPSLTSKDGIIEKVQLEDLVDPIEGVSARSLMDPIEVVSPRRLVDAVEEVSSRSYASNKKTLGKRKRQLIVRTPNGSNQELKIKRQQQSAAITRTLDNMRHFLPTVQEILGKVWENHPKAKALTLKPLGNAKPFCDGVKVPRTSVTSTERQVRELFRQHELKAHTVVAKEHSWFIKFDEDCLPNFDLLEERLKQMSDSAHEKLAGQAEFFLQQIDHTEEFEGFLYINDVKGMVVQLKTLGLKQHKDYKSTSLFLNLVAGENQRLKLYNKTIHPLFAVDSVKKKIGMGGKQFFQSSQFFHSRVRGSTQTGRLRAELSQYFYSKEEERAWFTERICADHKSTIISTTIKYLRKRGLEFIKEIPFDVVWKAFWSAPKAHIFVEEPLKAAVVYAYNIETKQYIGGLLDVTQKKDFVLFHKEHSIFDREAVVMKSGKIVDRFIKEDNVHCFPIFPRWNPRSIRYEFHFEGWDYHIKCTDVHLRRLNIQEEPSVSLQSSQGVVQDESFQQIMVKQTSEEPFRAEVAPQFPKQPLGPENIGIQNNKLVFYAHQQQKQVEERKRLQKEETKRIAKAAKEQGRANRDEDMDFFAVYYKEKCIGTKFKDLKKAQGQPKRILDMLQDYQKAGKIRKFVDNQRNKLGKK